MSKEGNPPGKLNVQTRLRIVSWGELGNLLQSIITMKHGKARPER